ncbi:MAG: hypothetical protein AABZ64_16460 [Nitrospinota bacterium]
MPATAENRRFRRYAFDESPILLEMPDLCQVLLEPDDISWGGFERPPRELGILGAKLRLPGTLQPPRPGMSVACGLEILGEGFPGLTASVPWASTIGGDDSGCAMGVMIRVPQDKQPRFRAAMKHSFAHLRLVQAS